MSKSALKKELSGMDREQLAQIILDAYEVNNDFKAYFEFFLNPDVESLLEKHERTIMKEISRVKWGNSKARTSVIKKEVKRFMGFNPGPEAILNMLFLTLGRVAVGERFINYKETQLNYITFLTKQIMEFAESNCLVSEALKRLSSDILESPFITVHVKNYVRKGLSTK